MHPAGGLHFRAEKARDRYQGILNPGDCRGSGRHPARASARSSSCASAASDRIALRSDLTHNPGNDATSEQRKCILTRRRGGRGALHTAQTQRATASTRIARIRRIAGTQWSHQKGIAEQRLAMLFLVTTSEMASIADLNLQKVTRLPLPFRFGWSVHSRCPKL